MGQPKRLHQLQRSVLSVLFGWKILNFQLTIKISYFFFFQVCDSFAIYDYMKGELTPLQ